MLEFLKMVNPIKAIRDKLRARESAKWQKNMDEAVERGKDSTHSRRWDYYRKGESIAILPFWDAYKSYRRENKSFIEASQKMQNRF